MSEKTYLIQSGFEPSHWYAMTKKVHGGHWDTYRWVYTTAEWEDMMDRLVDVSDGEATFSREANLGNKNTYVWWNVPGELAIRRSCWLIPVDPAKQTLSATVSFSCSYSGGPSGLSIPMNFWWADPPWVEGSNPWGHVGELAGTVYLGRTTRWVSGMELFGAKDNLKPHNYGSDGLTPTRFLTDRACLLFDVPGWQSWTKNYVGISLMVWSMNITVTYGRSVTAVPLSVGTPRSRGGKRGAAHRTRL